MDDLTPTYLLYQTEDHSTYLEMGKVAVVPAINTLVELDRTFYRVIRMKFVVVSHSSVTAHGGPEQCCIVTLGRRSQFNMTADLATKV